jgi:surfactin family lipopeptide synthetase C
LIAYLVPRAAAPDVRTLRARLKTRLPVHMVPSAFVFLDRLPVNGGGKLDRQALGSAPAYRRSSRRSGAAPRNTLERLLIKIWHDALGVDGLGIHDDFVEAGGDSLLGARIVARLRGHFPGAAALNHLFETPTVAELARSLIEREQEPGETERIAAVILRVEEMSDAEIRRALQDGRGSEADG